MNQNQEPNEYIVVTAAGYHSYGAYSAADAKSHAERSGWTVLDVLTVEQWEVATA